jgi:hypothetical protein
MNMHTFRAAMGVALVGTLSACTTLQVTSDVNPRASIAACHTYGWLPPGSPNGPAGHGAFGNPLNESRLHAAVDTNLQARGLTLAGDPQAADCMVGVAAGTRMVYQGDFGPYGFGWGVGYGWRGRGWGGFGGVGMDYPYAYPEGRIAVDLYDAHSHMPIWHASVNQNISQLTGEAAESKIDASVAALFQKYPAR